MDISDFIPTVDTVDIELKSPIDFQVMANTDGSPMTITMYLPHSKVYKEVRHAQTNKRIQESQKKNRKPVTAQDIEEETLELLVKTTAKWNITWKGGQPDFTEVLAREIYSLAPFIPEQLFEGVAEAEVFTKN